MSLDTFIPSESPESGSNAAEVAERLKEAIKRGAAGIKRTQKDEKKAKKNDMILAGFLVKIIIDKKYDGVLESLFTALNKGFSSNLVLGILSLIYEDISEKIRTISGKPYSPYTFSYNETVAFDDSHVDTHIKNRMNLWMEDVSDIITLEYSHVQIEELKKNIILHKQILIAFTAKVFIFFLNQSNVTISDSQALLISEFIIGEMETNIKQLKIEDV